MMAADVPLQVYGGVDTHKDVHVAAVTDHAGRVLGTASFPVTPDGYAGLLDWLNGHGELARAGVEGTGSYGAGLARYLAARGVRVLEVNRPDRQRRRRHGCPGNHGPAGRPTRGRRFNGDLYRHGKRHRAAELPMAKRHDTHLGRHFVELHHASHDAGR